MGVRANTTRGSAAAMAVLFTSLGAVSTTAHGELAFQFAGTLTNSGPGNDAFFFTVGSLDLLVTQLGEYNGTNEAHTVAIYRTDASFAPLELIISREITTTASYAGFQYVNVAPAGAILRANTKYFIVGNANSGKQLVTNMSIGLGSGIKSFDAYRWNTKSTHDPVTTLQSTSVYWGSNFQYEAIPAPATLAALGALIGLVRRRTR
ncbi:MAG: hypothetical protein RLY21_1352 [Planctomycetota bacterium]|jgi:hypothetical protein